VAVTSGYKGTFTVAAKHLGCVLVTPKTGIAFVNRVNIQVEYRWTRATSITSRPTRLIWCF
jgi:hypothetical protein